ncbi:MAG: hypothetical protein SNJ75_07170 [Gemmataceae bacterium]
MTTMTTKTNLPTPDWLAQRGGGLRPSTMNPAVSVYFAGQLQYVLLAVPAKGKYACRISETINGRRLDAPELYETPLAALEGGLAHLREKLGW